MLTIRQQEGESLRDCVKRFNKAVLEIDKVDDQIIMMTFQAGLNNLDLIFSLGKTPPTSMTNLLFKAQKYMNGEDAFTAKGLMVRRKIVMIHTRRLRPTRVVLTPQRKR